MMYVLLSLSTTIVSLFHLHLHFHSLLLLGRAISLFKFIKENNRRLLNRLNEGVESLATQSLIDYNRWNILFFRCLYRDVLGQESLATALFARQQDSRGALARQKGMENAIGVMYRVAVDLSLDGKVFNLFEKKGSVGGIDANRVGGSGQSFVDIECVASHDEESFTLLDEIGQGTGSVGSLVAGDQSIYIRPQEQQTGEHGVEMHHHDHTG